MPQYVISRGKTAIEASLHLDTGANGVLLGNESGTNRELGGGELQCYTWGAMLRCYVEGSLLLLVSYIVEELWIITSYLVGKMSLMNEVAFSLNTANHYHL